MDEMAQQAITAYRRIIRMYRHPSHAPELSNVMKALNDADAYYQSIPANQLRPHQERIWGQIKNLLMRDC
jgi:hypothetical protein